MRGTVAKALRAEAALRLWPRERALVVVPGSVRAKAYRTLRPVLDAHGEQTGLEPVVVQYESRSLMNATDTQRAAYRRRKAAFKKGVRA